MTRLLLPILLVLAPFARGADDASDVGVAFLKKIAAESVELATDTAITEGTTVEKRETINKDFKRLAKTLRLGKLRALDHKIDGELAAVLVAQVVEFDPSQLQVHAVALLKRGDQWLPAPVLASFENTGITYIPRLSGSASQLQDWMLSTRADQLVELRDKTQADLLRDIQQAKSAAELQNARPRGLILDFVSACQKRDLPAALACLGGLETPLPPSWQDILSLTASAFRSPEKAPSSAWKQLCSPSVLHTVVEVERLADGVIVSLGQLDPKLGNPGQPEITIRPFPFDRTESGLWRLRLPVWLLDDPEDQGDSPAVLDLIEAFPTKLLKQYPPQPFPSAETLMSSFRKALTGPEFAAVLPHIATAGDEQQAHDALFSAVRLWREFRGTPSFSPLLLEVHQDGDQACALVCRFDARNPKIRASLIKRLFLVRQENGWLLDPYLNERPDQAPGIPALNKWADDCAKLDQTEWLARIDLVATLGGIPADSAPSEADARRAAENWIAAISTKDPRAILATVAAFDDESGGEKLLRAIGQELQTTTAATILGIHRQGRWAAATVLYSPADPRDPAYQLLYPIVSTPKGPRILAEGLLFHANTRSREFINTAIWSRLTDRLPEPAVAELRQIHQAHATLSEQEPAESD